MYTNKELSRIYEIMYRNLMKETIVKLAIKEYHKSLQIIQQITGDYWTIANDEFIKVFFQKGIDK